MTTVARRLTRGDWNARHLYVTTDAHPDPIFDHAGRSVIFTTDVEGRRAVARVTPSDR